MKTDLKQIILLLNSKYKSYIQPTMALVEDLYTIIQCVKPEYRLYIFHKIYKYLSEEDYAKGLKYAYMKTSGINTINSCLSLDDTLKLFKNANLKELMGTDYNDFINLPDDITIYRGTATKKYSDAISWTIDKKRAIWFYKKYESKGTVYQAKIKKEDVICFLDKSACFEKEVVVNYKKIFSVTELPNTEIDKDIIFDFEDEGGANIDYVISCTQKILQMLAYCGILPSKKLAEEIFKSYQTKGEYKSNYEISFFTGEKFMLHELLSMIN